MAMDQKFSTPPQGTVLHEPEPLTCQGYSSKCESNITWPQINQLVH